MKRPSAAERARTLAYGVADGVLAAPGVPYAPVTAHVTEENGRSLLLIPAASPVAVALKGEPDLPATLRISDVAPVALADRVRGRAWLHGWVTEVPAGERRDAAVRLSRLHPRPELLDLDGNGDWTLLALEVAEVEVDDAWGTATLEPEEYAAASPDPFVAIEGGILEHLDAAHRPELAALVGDRITGRIGGADGGPGLVPVVRPLSLDRYGMWLRCRYVTGSDGHDEHLEPLDLRVVFPEPVSDLHSLRCVYRRLLVPRAS
ncbi:DUF2470 domain-containing protein [Spirillospora sp. NPDC047279]|uniref:DUF2470 domain-containing protein n=1 Tax=Spirillospora sp. NPDC047279 TaxID=3155478 RepID=UPI0034031647